jgi:hypothetical protein
MNKLALILGLAIAPFAYGQALGYIPPAMTLYDSSGNPYPNGSGTPLGYIPPPFTCYTLSGGVAVPCSFAAAGVTSVALTGSNTFFSSTPGTPVTGSGNLNVDAQLATQVANCFFAGPTSGGAATPTCRALVNADFPSSLAPVFSAANLTNFPGGAFNTLTGGTNTTATMVIGTGASLATSGSGTITATSSTASTNLAGGAVGSLPYQNAAGATLFIVSPTTSGHFFVPSWQPSGSAIAPVSLDLATYLASPAAIGGTAPATGAFTTETLSGNGAASVSPLLMNGTILTGGSGTTNFPSLFLQPTGTTASTTWSTSGTGLGMNLASGFVGNFIDFDLNGSATHALIVDSGGHVTAQNSFNIATIVQLSSSAASAVQLGNTSLIDWSNGACCSGKDTVLDRNSAGVLEINNVGGTAGSGGSLKLQKVLTSANCASGASPAVCAAAAAGAVAIPTGVNSTLVVNTTAVTTSSQILLTVDDSLTIAATTCNSTLATLVGGVAITARTAGTSFTISFNGTITTNPVCLSYSIIN